MVLEEIKPSNKRKRLHKVGTLRAGILYPDDTEHSEYVEVPTKDNQPKNKLAKYPRTSPGLNALINDMWFKHNAAAT